MANFKPQVHYTTEKSMHEYFNNGRKSMTIIERFKTYRELKKKLPAILEDSVGNCVSVYRSKRAQWGEWYERWGLDTNKKPIIRHQEWS
jgi:hypothetical protein